MKHFITLSILAGLWMPLAAQKVVPALSTNVLARVGGSVITAKDLIERIELMPWPEKEQPDRHDSAKVKALNSLIAERLLAIEGKQQRVGSDEGARAKVQGMEKLFVRDELYKREVRQKITVSEEEIRDGLAKFAWQLHVTAIALTDESAADSLHRMLRRNPSQAAALKAFPARFVTAVETVQVNFGGLDTAFENNAYAIGRKKFSKPFQCPTYGWTIAMLQDRGTNPVAEKMSAGDRRYRVDEMLRNAKEAPIGRRFIASVLVSQKATVDSVAFERLADVLYEMISKDPERHYTKGVYGLTPEDFDASAAALASDLRREFVQMNDRPMTLGEGLESLRHLRLGFPSLEAKKFKGSLNGHVRFVVETELLAREGYRRNLQHAENVKRDVDIWSNYWSSRYLKWNIDDSVRVSQEELLEAVKRNMQVLELDPTGRIVSMNRAFSKTFKTRAEDAQGKHHSDFVHQDYRELSEYSHIWSKLTRGKAVAQELKMVTAEDAELWMQNLFIPVTSLSGQTLKIVCISNRVIKDEFIY